MSKDKLAEALRLISFASMDRGARDTATEALAAYEQAQAEPKQAAEPAADRRDKQIEQHCYEKEALKCQCNRLTEELADAKEALTKLCESVHEANLRAMFPKQTSGTSEPIAWRLKSPPGSTYTAVFNPGKPDAQTLEYWGRNGGEIEYAYAAPGAQAEPWVPVSERMPDDPQDCVFYSPDLRNPVPMLMGLYIRGKFKCAGYEMVNVTHWMPPPQPPKENKHD